MTENQDWLKQLEGWHADGTIKRLAAAAEAKTRVVIRRNNNVEQPCTIIGLGHGGRSIQVQWEERTHSGEPDGDRYKVVNTEDFLVWNPGFVGSTSGESDD